MIGVEPWSDAVPRPITTLTRIVRSTGQPLESVDLDSALLAACAQGQQGIFVERCKTGDAADFLDRAASAVERGIIWVIAGTGNDYWAVRSAAEKRKVRCFVYYGHSAFKEANSWERRRLRLVLSSADDLRGSGKCNLRKRDDLKGVFCPLLVVVDADLTICSIPPGTTFDPAWTVRDSAARICARQQAVPIVVLTARDVASVSPSSVQRAFGVSGLLYARLGGA